MIAFGPRVFERLPNSSPTQAKRRGTPSLNARGTGGRGRGRGRGRGLWGRCAAKKKRPEGLRLPDDIHVPHVCEHHPNLCLCPPNHFKQSLFSAHGELPFVNGSGIPAVLGGCCGRQRLSTTRRGTQVATPGDESLPYYGTVCPHHSPRHQQRASAAQNQQQRLHSLLLCGPLRPLSYNNLIFIPSIICAARKSASSKSSF